MAESTAPVAATSDRPESWPAATRPLLVLGDRWSRALAGLPVLLIIAAAFAVTAVYLRGIHNYTVMADELGYVKQSIQIAHTGFLLRPGSFYFDSWAQLLPLLYAPIFGLLSMAHAFYVAHTVGALILASTAMPAYLLARELRLGRLAAYLVAALSVAVPWMIIAGEVMTDVVAYPVFTWAILAMLRAVHTASVRRDALAIAAVALAFFARTQFSVLLPIFPVAVLLQEVVWSLSTRTESRRHAAISGLRAAFRKHPLMWSVCGVLAAWVIGATVAGSGRSIFGGYVTTLTYGSLLPAGTFASGIGSLEEVALGIGIVPVTLATVWAITTLFRPRDALKLAYAILLILVVLGLVVMAGSFEARFLAGGQTDRYLFYLAPVLFTGAIAWIADARGSLIGVLLVAVVAAWMVLGVSLQYLSLVNSVNPSFIIDRVFIGQTNHVARAVGIGSLDARIPIAIVATTFALAAVPLRRHLRPWQALLAIAVPILLYGTVETGYAMKEVRQQASNVPPTQGEQLGWIDRAVPSGAHVGLLLATTGNSEPLNWSRWWDINFWNKSVQAAYVFPGGDSFAQGPAGTVHEDLSHGRLLGARGVDYLVTLDSDPRLGLRATHVVSADGATLYKLLPGDPLTYATSGVDDGGGLVGPHPFVRMFAPDRGGVTKERVTLSLSFTHPSGKCPCTLVLGNRYGAAHFGANGAIQGDLQVTRIVRITAGHFAQMDLEAVDRRGQRITSGVQLAGVRIAPIA